MCRLVPSLPLSVGLGPVFAPEGRLDRTRVERLPLPPDLLNVVVPFEKLYPYPLEDSLTHPLLEPAVGGRARAILLRKSLPLTSGPEHVEYPIEDPPERHRRSPSGTGHLLLS